MIKWKSAIADITQWKCYLTKIAFTKRGLVIYWDLSWVHCSWRLITEYTDSGVFVFVYLCICIWLVLVVKYGMHWVPCAYQLTRVWMLPQHMACVGLNSTQGSLLIQHKTAPYQQTHFLSAKMEGKSFQCQPPTSMIKYKYYTLQLVF